MLKQTKFTGVQKRRAHLRDLQDKVTGIYDRDGCYGDVKRQVMNPAKDRRGVIIDIRESFTLRDGTLVRIFNRTESTFSYEYKRVKKDGTVERKSGQVGVHSGVHKFSDLTVFIE